jgi:AcrR family transcriptional regulator
MTNQPIPTADPPRARGGPAPVRRSQQQRLAQTRAKLLDATIEILLHDGYAALTTRAVHELAGVSHGAQVHHFPYRIDLVTAAIDELAQRRIGEFAKHVATLPTDPADRAGQLLDLVWEDFSSDVFTVFVKVWVAAADDPELHARLVPIEHDLARSIGEIIRTTAGDLPDTHAAARLPAVLHAIRGLALTQEFEPRDRRGRDPWPELRASLLEILCG